MFVCFPFVCRCERCERCLMSTLFTLLGLNIHCVLFLQLNRGIDSRYLTHIDVWLRFAYQGGPWKLCLCTDVFFLNYPLAKYSSKMCRCQEEIARFLHILHSSLFLPASHAEIKVRKILKDHCSGSPVHNPHAFLRLQSWSQESAFWKWDLTVFIGLYIRPVGLNCTPAWSWFVVLVVFSPRRRV